MEGLKVTGLSKSFGASLVIDSLDFEVEGGELCILLGPSGCGKSTVLRLIAGLEQEDEGDIYLGGRRVNDLQPRDRDIAMVFQSYALYPHLSAYENMAFPLRVRKLPGEQIDRTVREAAALLGLEGLLKRKPSELSGGQRQRVAMGRAIVRKPGLFLFDEPLSNLDAKLRAAMRVELAGLHRKLGATMLYVTHDQVEAMTLGEKIILLEGGRVQQAGTPRELYAKPFNLFVASFVGSPQINLIDGRLASEGGLYFRSEPFAIEVPPGAGVAGHAGEDVTLGIRPESLLLGEGPIKGEIELVEHIGSESIIYVRAGGGARLAAREKADFGGKAGETISLDVDAHGLHFFYQGKRIGS